MATVTEVTSVEQLDQYRLVWKSLWQQTPGASFLDSLDWLTAHCAATTNPQQKLMVLLAESGGKVIGILPLVAVGKRHLQLSSPQTSIGSTSSLLGPNPTGTLCAAALHLAATPDKWTELQLNLCRRLHRRAVTAFQLAGLPHHSHVIQSVDSVNLPDIWQLNCIRDSFWSNPVRFLSRRVSCLA